WHFDIMSTSFFLSRRALKPASHSAMPRWQDRLFIGLAKSASDATDFFHLPTGRVVEVGTQVAGGAAGGGTGREPLRKYLGFEGGDLDAIAPVVLLCVPSKARERSALNALL